jgi:anti-anti-sigma regulatory factor
MRWRLSRGAHVAVASDPLVLALTAPLTRETATDLVDRVRVAADNAPVIIDLTGIAAFDSDGAAAIAGLQEQLGAERLTVIGFRQAAARLLGSDDTIAPPAPPQQEAGSPWVVRRMRAIAVVQSPEASPSMAGFEAAVSAALDEEVGIVVIDLRGATLSRAGVQAVAFASSTAALHGQELLVVNVDHGTVERLHRQGMSATTYVAPEPLPL